MARAPQKSDPLCRYVDRVINRLRRRVPSALHDWDADAIHDVRVSTRRLRAALELLSSVLPPKRVTPLRKTARRVRRRLGSLRDFDVMLVNLDKLARRPRLAAAAKWTGDRVRDQRDVARRKTRKKRSVSDLLDRLDEWKSLREHVCALQAAIEPQMIMSLRSQWDAFAAKADSRSSGLFDAGREAIVHPHELRIAGKMLRYTFEMHGEAGHKLPQMVSRAFKRMQKVLGDWHDCVVLAECIMQMSLDESVAQRDPAMQSKLLALLRFLMRRGDRDLRKFAQLWRDDGDALEEVVDAITAPQTDHGLRRLDESPTQESPTPDASSAA